MTKKEYRKDDTPPSDMFVNSLVHGNGSPDMECGWCSRMHLCPESNSYTSDEDGGDGWKEQCLQDHKDNPEGVVLHWDSDAIMGYMFNSINFVIDCPCNGLYRYETFIWAERASIRNYLKKRIDQEYEFAQQERSLNVLAGIANTDKEKEQFWF